MTYPEDIEDKLGFTTIRHLLIEKCLSELGVRKCREMSFSRNAEDIKMKLRRTSEMKNLLLSADPMPTANFHDMTTHLEQLRTSGTYLQENILFRLLQSLQTFDALVSFFCPANDASPKYPLLAKFFLSSISFSTLQREISSVLNRFGEVKDTASPELAEITGRLNAAMSSVSSTMRRIADHAKAEGLISKDTVPSMRDGRLVLPVGAADKRRIAGIIQDESASGKTVFIEPQEIVEINNRIKSLEAERRREIIRILVRVADAIRPEIDSLLDVYEVLATIDFIRAKALAAIELGGNLPFFDDKSTIEWYNAFHPTLALTLRKQNRAIVPMSLRLDGKKRILVISGPNAGGKSVALKTVGINQYMLQCGMLPSLDDNSHVSIFDNLFIDIGDQQSIENDLSTYSSHLRNMKYFISKSSNRAYKTIVLIDEMGSGTEPQIGAALAQAILACLDRQHVFAVITTHYQNLKSFAETHESMLNAAMLYDRSRLEPLFKLSIGHPGSSFALEIAKKTGLPKDVIDDARQIVGDEYVNIDKYLLDIDRDKKYWSSKRLTIKEKEKRLDEILEKYENKSSDLRERRNDIINQARIEAANIIKETNARIEKTIREIKTADAEKERTKQLRAELKQYAEEIETKQIQQPEILKGSKRKRKTVAATKDKPQLATAPLQKGDTVVMDGSNTPGTIIDISGKNATVVFGALRTSVALDKLKRSNISTKTSSSATTMSVSVQTSNAIREKQLHFNPEIDVRGMRVDEAIQAVTYFLDDAIQFNAQRIRILHGTGTGALRMAIRSILSAHNSVRNFHDEDVRFGGAGITVVNLE